MNYRETIPMIHILKEKNIQDLEFIGQSFIEPSKRLFI